MSTSSSSSSSVMLPSKATTFTCAALYVVSGICQPLIMTLCKEAGLANPSAQLYMFFYYLGPALVLPTLFCGGKQAENNNRNSSDQNSNNNKMTSSSSSSSSSIRNAVIMSSLIAMFDIVAAAMNYTGASLAGPTVFAIVYSSVTIWTAVFSRIFLKRTMVIWQWIAVFAVFGGLCITALNSVQLGPAVSKGTILVVVGSMMHGGTYCMNEAIMTVTQQTLSVRQNTAVQGTTAATVMGVWQLVYTLPRYDELIGQPTNDAGTSFLMASMILISFLLANLVHSLTYYHTLKFYAGGATSAGCMKGLQAVLVFVAAHIWYCGRIGGNEMCFSTAKFVSLVTVCGGVTLYGYLTERQEQHRQSSSSPSSFISPFRQKQGYTAIPHGYDDGEGGSLSIVEVEAIHV